MAAAVALSAVEKGDPRMLQPLKDALKTLERYPSFYSDLLETTTEAKKTGFSVAQAVKKWISALNSKGTFVAFQKAEAAKVAADRVAAASRLDSEDTIAGRVVAANRSLRDASLHL